MLVFSKKNNIVARFHCDNISSTLLSFKDLDLLSYVNLSTNKSPVVLPFIILLKSFYLRKNKLKNNQKINEKGNTVFVALIEDDSDCHD